jgi:hypothetical protein
MRISVTPLLSVQRELYDLPDAIYRFQRYVQVMNDGKDGPILPLALMNPMAKPNVAAMIDSLFAFDAEAVAFTAAQEATRRLPGDDELRVALVAADDAGGGWTNR